MATVSQSVRIVARGLSEIMAAAAAFAAAPARRTGDPTTERRQRFAGVRIAAAGGSVGIESTDPFDAIRFHAMAAIGDAAADAAVSVDAAALAGFARGGFDAVDILADAVSIGSATVAAVDPGPAGDWCTVDFPHDAVAATVHLEPRHVRAIVDGIAVAADDDSARYALGGVLFDVAPRVNRCPALHCVGTDGRRLHVATFAGHVDRVRGDGRCAAIVPRGALVKIWRAIRATVPRALSATSPAVRVSIAAPAGGRAIVRFCWTGAGGFDCAVDVAAIEGRFPRWRDCFGIDAAGERVDVSHNPGAFDAAAAGIGDTAANVETFAAPGDALAEIVAGALRGVCKPAKRGDRPAAVALSAGSPIPPAGGPCWPRVHVATAAGSIDRETDGAASPGFDVSIDPRFLGEALAGLKMFRALRGDRGTLATFAVPRPERPGQFGGIHVRAGRGVWARDSFGFAAIIMPVSRP